MRCSTGRYAVTVLIIGIALILMNPAVGYTATQPIAAHLKLYNQLYDQVADKFGRRTPGRNIARWGLATRAASDQDIVRSLEVLTRMLAPPPAPKISVSGVSDSTTSAPVTDTGGGYGSVPGVPSSFASCVAMRESTNGADSSNIYGILPSNGYYSGMSVAAQEQRFSQMYGSQGSAPWSPYDGC